MSWLGFGDDVNDTHDAWELSEHVSIYDDETGESIEGAIFSSPWSPFDFSDVSPDACQDDSAYDDGDSFDGFAAE